MDSSHVDSTTLLAMQMQSHRTVVRTRRRNVRSERLRGTFGGAAEGAKCGRNRKKKEGEEGGRGGGRRGTRILGDYRARHQRITASEDKIYM